jgi:hypothetical protein
MKKKSFHCENIFLIIIIFFLLLFFFLKKIIKFLFFENNNGSLRNKTSIKWEKFSFGIKLKKREFLRNRVDWRFGKSLVKNLIEWRLKKFDIFK